ncbi:SPOR domain-containing protein [Sneathiella chinensis]|uniref:SPOR domain-containing protein n=1 Tax=Sneathiella chinensis TaxID=349750 RepID=A0ABQ5U8G7_9PROT|nr:SPOR domain-containing protein [Sneathiella chinensis]GLQ07480.1 hypothetical protein GCM10007924_27010 [Sneathiella chinensis]
MTNHQDFPEEEEYYEEYDEPRFSRGKLIGAALAVTIVAGFGIGIWYAYDQGVKKGVQLAPPIVKADTSPVKQQPENPGGMDIPHQDKQVFSVLNPEQAEEKVEKLMEAPEESTNDPAPVDITETEREAQAGNQAETLMAKPEGQAASDAVSDATTEAEAAATAAARTPVEKVQREQETAANTVKEVEAKAAEAKPEPKPEAKPEAKPAPEPEKVAAPAPVKAGTSPKKPANAGDYRVQIGAFRSTDAAEQAWGRLQKAHKALLTGVPHFIQSVEVKGKGMFHRLQAGAFENRAGAENLCTALKAEKQDCLVAKK